jgi:predicted nucleotidyltransferase
MQKIALSQTELDIIKDILRDTRNVVFFGSRVKGTSGPFSDLDICLKDPISPVMFQLLQEKFENSDLSFAVDLVEYNKVNPSFQKIIDNQGIAPTYFFNNR